jgi:L-lactate dehydrogenase complex protein LldF
MTSAAGTFDERVRRAVGDQALSRSLASIQTHLVAGRSEAVAAVPEFELLRDAAAAIKSHALANLDVYLEIFETKVREAGGSVHWAATADEANRLIAGLCAASAAKLVIKSKSMVSEEIELNAHLQRAGLRVVETDLGEYIIQLRNDRPSHIVAPSVHLNRGHYEAAFREAHRSLDPGRDLEEPQALLAEARAVLRECFVTADVGITGANFLVAETGSIVVVTNEGNADLTQPSRRSCRRWTMRC